MKTAIVLHEPEQFAMLPALRREWQDKDGAPSVISLHAGVDYELDKQGEFFLSAQNFQNRETPASYLRADTLVRQLCADPVFAAMLYRGISVMESLRFTVQLYFIDLLYFVELLSRIIDAHPEIERIVVPTPTTLVPSTSAPLAEHEAFMVMEAARLVAKSRNLVFAPGQGRSVPLRLRNKLRSSTFFLKRTFFGTGLFILNAAMALRKRRPIRLIVTDYWKNVSPLLRQLPNAETILFDRTEALNAGWKNIWKYKLRFMHFDHFLSWKTKQDAVCAAREFERTWEAQRSSAWQTVDFSFCGVDLRPISEAIMTRLILCAVPNLTRMVAGIYGMYERLTPEAVLVRASVSRQAHFILLPQVAYNMGIPALEIQHGGEYLGTGSATRNHAAYYIATYGPLVTKEYREQGYAPERLITAGSPRFDAYIRDVPKAQKSHDRKELMVLSNTPNANVGERFGAYSVAKHFAALGEALRYMPNAKLTITSRSNAQDRFISEAIARGLRGVPYARAGTTPLPELFKEAEIFVCTHSTVVYEALLYRLPVIIASFAPVERMMTDFHFGPFEKAGAVAIAHTPEELREIVGRLASDAEARERMSIAGEAFMQKQFSFDGHASERIADTLRAWAGTQYKKTNPAEAGS